MFGEIVDKSSISFDLKLNKIISHYSCCKSSNFVLLEILNVFFDDFLIINQSFPKRIEDVPTIVVNVFIILMSSSNFFALSLV